ncbi:DNA polymerase I [Candidatus Avelusimicrobium luingense]|uniref:DNA polymerase I n=1 Tax=Candidatus Avelusimicrobium luingense TaxID=3416211 RepID=UPI003D0A59A6
MTEFSPQFFLIDAHNFLHRNYHALPKLTTSSGQEVGALYGFVRWLLKMLKEHHPAYVAVCFDSPGGCARRKALLPSYKGTRKKPDDALISQLNIARDLVSRLGLAVVAKPGIEADDLMAFLAREAAKQQVPSVLATTDKDVYQFLNDYIHIWPAGGKDGFKGPEAAKEKFGVEVNFLPDYFAIVGDAADNIPGVHGVGPKSAVELIEKFGHLADILRAAHNDNPDIKPALAKKLLAGEGEALLSKQLVVFDSNLDMPFSLEDYRVHMPQRQVLDDLFAQYEFKNLWEYLDVPPAVSPVKMPDGPEQQLTLSQALEKATALPRVFLHAQEELVLLGLSAHEFSLTPMAQVQPWELDALKKLVQNDAVEKSGYDLKLTLRELDINAQGQKLNCFDSRLARYLLNPSGDLSFSGACAEYFSAQLQEENPQELLRAYNRYGFALQEILTQKLKESAQYDLFRNLELPLMSVLSAMEYNGLRVDPGFLESFQVVLEKEIAQLQQSIDTRAGYAVNVNSPKQLGILLFEQMKIPPVKRTKTGYSTDEEVLAQLAPSYPIAQEILDYRADAKLKSTYVDNLLLLADEEHKVHSYLDQTGTVTGRLSSSSPNLQNIPVRTEKGRYLRKAFCAAPGNVMLSVDYSQIDLRVLAHESQDPVLVQAFLDGGDIHTQTAAQVFGVMPLMVTDEMRSSAKAINFGIIYGQGPMGLSQALGISLREAKEYIDNYFKNFRVVREWIDDNIAKARQNGYVKTMLGHIRYLPEFNMGIGSMASFAQRAAINTIVQGGSADIIKKAMLDVFDAYRNSAVKMTMQVHDELLFEVPADTLMQTAGHIKQLMQNTVKLRVPLLAAAKAGANWYEMKKIPL